MTSLSKSIMVFAWVAGFALPTTAADEHHPSRAADSASTTFQREMDAGMAKMMKDMHSPAYTGNPDIDFLTMMIPHHEGAVEMARLLLIHGADPVTRKLAEDIIASQQAEIEGMRRRLAQLRARGTSTQPDEFPALGGTRGMRNP
ncbi:MAG: DUF305 domain-containing protein [Rhodospirillaceae bacterium]